MGLRRRPSAHENLSVGHIRTHTNTDCFLSRILVAGSTAETHETRLADDPKSRRYRCEDSPPRKTVRPASQSCIAHFNRLSAPRERDAESNRVLLDLPLAENGHSHPV